MTRDSKKRTDLSGDDTPLTASPFGGLAGIRASDLPVHQAEKSPEPTVPKLPYAVTRSRKRNFVIRKERRGGNKSVTILENISGNREALLKDLKKHCATGGVCREDGVELQGDLMDKVQAWLEKQGF